MDFSEKLTALLQLSGVKSVSLANAVNIDTAQISRLKTGAREMPQNPKLLQDISRYLADNIDNGYKLSALNVLTGDYRLQSPDYMDTLADVLFEWLTMPTTDISGIKTEHFLKGFTSFSAQPEIAEPADSKGFPSFAGKKCEILTYSRNAGKRQATSDFFSYVRSLEKPCSIRVFTDEIDDWMIEDSNYSVFLMNSIRNLTQRDFHIQRIQPPTQNMEGAFRDIERWLQAYMSGNLSMFYYPWARDELHRRTLLIAPGQIAMSSYSLYGVRESSMTTLTTSPEAVNSFNGYFSNLMERCRPMMSTYTIAEKHQVLDHLQEISRTVSSGIYKSNMLSAHTIPKEALITIKKRSSLYIRRVLECYEQSECFKAEVLKNNTIVDIMSLPDLDNVLNEKEPIPGTSIGNDVLFYTPNEYRLHLHQIIWYLETYPNYQVVLLDNQELPNTVIYTKGDRQTILLKESAPFAMYSITEPGLASSFSGYLKHLIMQKSYSGSRVEIIALLRNEITQIPE